MADSDSNSGVRRRKPTSEEDSGAQPDAEVKTDKKKSKKRGTRDDATEYGNPWVDVLRVLSFLLLVSCGLSYLVSGGESFFWTMKVPPKYLRMETWRSMLVRTRHLPHNHIPKHHALEYLGLVCSWRSD